MNTPLKKKHPWGLYLVACFFLHLGGSWMIQYRLTGSVEDRKHNFVHYGKDALVAALAPLFGGVFALGSAIRVSFKKDTKQAPLVTESGS